MEESSMKMGEKKTEASESVLLKSLIKLVIRRWYFFVIVGVIAAVFGYIYASNKKPVFESHVSFALDDGAEGGNSAAMGLASQLGISLGGPGNVFAGDNILKIMVSRRMIEDALLSVDTIDGKPITLIEYYRRKILPEETLTLPDVSFLPGEPRKSFSYTKDSLLYQVQLNFNRSFITVQKPNNDLNIYELMVRSPDERFSKLFTESLIRNTDLFYTEIKSKKSRETFEILEKRVPAVKSKLDASIRTQADIEDANLNTAFARAQVGQLQEMSDSKVYGAAYAEMFKNLEVARFQYLKSIPLMQIIDAPNYPMQKIKPGKIYTALVFAVVGVFLLFLGFMAFIFFRFLRTVF